MILTISSSMRPSLAALGMRWLVLAVLMVGTIISSIGSMNSHGLAAIETTRHAESFATDKAHGHVHGDREIELAISDLSAGADHPHHEADHSHDNSHALSITWGSAATLLRSWQLLVRPWTKMVQASRLERPPMG